MPPRRRTKPYRCGYPCDHLIDPSAPPPLRTISLGWGVQSTALLVLTAQGRIDYDAFLFANVGDDSEDTATLTYARDHGMPYAAANGIPVYELNKTRRDGSVETLLGKLTRPGGQSLSIPYRSHADGPPMSRSCTAEFKARVVGRWRRAHGASPDHRMVVGMGISLDESTRANLEKAEPWEDLRYPLISLGEDTGLQLRRSDCAQIIRAAGLPVPPKSSCWFCPHHTLAAWADQRRDRPETFDRSCQLEEELNARSTANGTGPVFLSRAGIPLRQAVDAGQDTLFGGDFDTTAGECDSGYCWT